MGKASRAKRQARELRNRETVSQQALRERLQQNLPAERINFLKLHRKRKVSEVLMEFAEPWLDEARDDDQRRMIIGMAVLAWNMAELSEPKRWDEMSPELVEKLGEPGRAILREMIARKLSLYPNEDRAILDYEVTGAGDDLRVDVAYTPSSEEMTQIKQSGQGLAGL